MRVMTDFYSSVQYPESRATRQSMFICVQFSAEEKSDRKLKGRETRQDE